MCGRASRTACFVGVGHVGHDDDDQVVRIDGLAALVGQLAQAGERTQLVLDRNEDDRVADVVVDCELHRLLAARADDEALRPRLLERRGQTLR